MLPPETRVSALITLRIIQSVFQSAGQEMPVYVSCVCVCVIPCLHISLRLIGDKQTHNLPPVCCISIYTPLSISIFLWEFIVIISHEFTRLGFKAESSIKHTLQVSPDLVWFFLSITPLHKHVLIFTASLSAILRWGGKVSVAIDAFITITLSTTSRT